MPECVCLKNGNGLGLFLEERSNSKGEPMLAVELSSYGCEHWYLPLSEVRRLIQAMTDRESEVRVRSAKPGSRYSLNLTRGRSWGVHTTNCVYNMCTADVSIVGSFLLRLVFKAGMPEKELRKLYKALFKSI